MGLFRCVTRVGLVMLLIALPDLALGECVFGPDSLAQLIRRNNTIIGIMNDTLVNYTTVVDAAIGKSNPGYSVSGYLQSQYKTTPDNFLDFVSMGKLLAINWYNVATALRASDPQGISSYINTSYTFPLHDKLQDIASLYSFSLGIFRPKNLQYNFTVIKNDSTVTGNSSLDNSCIAGTYFLWKISTDLPYSTAFTNTRSIEFASLASTLENAFNEYYRRNTSTLNTEYVRANLIHTNGTNSTVTAYMETYFFGYYHEIQNITNLTSLAGLQAMWSNIGVPSTLVTLSINLTFIISASHPPISPTLSTSNSSTQKKTTVTIASPLTELTIGNPVSTASTITPSSTTSTGKTTVPTTPSTISSPSSPDKSTEAPDGLVSTGSIFSSLYPNLTANMTSIQAPQAPNTSSYPSSLTSSTASATLTSNPPSLGSTSPMTMLTSPLSTESSVPANNTNGMTQTVDPLNGITMSPVFSSNSQNSTITLQNPWTSSSIMADVLNTTNTSQTTQSSQLIVNLTTINLSNGLLPSNSSTLAVSSNQTGNAGIAGNQTGNASRSVDGGTTFDPDPLFKANVPVMAKVYNDDFLLKSKIGTMTPITSMTHFMSITIPTAIGVIAATISCLLCLQIDCLRSGDKI